MSMTKATAEIVAIIETMYADGQNDIFDDDENAVDDKETAEDGESPTKKAKLCDDEALPLTTTEAVKLSQAAMLYHIIVKIEWGYDAVEGAEAFSDRVVKRAETKLKPQYKNEFDVNAIAEALRKKADVMSC